MGDGSAAAGPASEADPTRDAIAPRPPLSLRVLGPLTAERGPQPIALGGALQRAVLAVLLLRPGSVVAPGRMVDLLWGEQPPRDPRAALQAHVSNLRRALAKGGADAVVRTEAGGYRAVVGRDTLDLLRFEEELRGAVLALAADEPDTALAHHERALAEWRGHALADLVPHPLPASLTRSIDERRAEVEEERLDLLLGLGRHRGTIAELEAAVAAHPLRERLWALLATASYRAGRQADALRAIAFAGEVLREQLGLEPGAELRDLEARILAQAADLAWTPRAGQARRSPHTTTIPRLADAAPARLVTVDGTSVELGPWVTTIGRDDDCDLTLADAEVSRRHAEVRPTVAGHLLVDLGSTNGTSVAGEPVVRHVLRPGDDVEVATHVLRFETD